ncbi:hypothetical protein [Pseudomonas proteolytica]|uniref:hypothetical protein n=1 Tax=Pseudomonas proteolytica TaxID=219574 RepID=UPI00089A8626|nr:hypothetical protein [Pseudomonas proteolytica]KAA8705200.1 hypothetical protein F4W61_05310 [Pseudomonas proteolytica]TWR85865.1 hypothetical protein FIV38_01450 [Pseudomonas proteolytica]SED30717.1 hypothetical protein SAMN04490200_1009 [Pseudomonas proteolytica]
MSTTTERPILFSGTMVQTILSGQKTVTRRVLKIPHGFWETSATGELVPIPAKCPYGTPGDRLWVRETWAADAQVDAVAPRDLSKGEPIHYPADGAVRQTGCAMVTLGKSRPSIHMPRWVSRILLEITDVRVERLHAITNEQCIAEGAKGGHGSIPGYIYNATVQEHFRYIWESTGGDYFANPWVWVIGFKRVTQGRVTEGGRDDA